MPMNVAHRRYAHDCCYYYCYCVVVIVVVANDQAYCCHCDCFAVNTLDADADADAGDDADDGAGDGDDDDAAPRIILQVQHLARFCASDPSAHADSQIRGTALPNNLLMAQIDRQL